MTDHFDLVSFSAAYLSRYLLALVRVLGAIMLNPMLGSARVPMPARVGLCLFVTLIIFPPAASMTPLAVGPLEVAGELLVGLLAGFAIALIFAAVQFVGGLINVNSGMGFGGTVDPSLNLGTGAIEQFVSLFALLVFVQINGHHLFLAGLQQLFDTVPVGTVARLPGNVEGLAEIVSGVFAAAIMMALPVLAALVVADLGLAILTRIAPQMNLFALGFPLKIAVALVGLLLALPVILPRLIAMYRVLPQAMQALAG